MAKLKIYSKAFDSSVSYIPCDCCPVKATCQYECKYYRAYVRLPLGKARKANLEAFKQQQQESNRGK